MEIFVQNLLVIHQSHFMEEVSIGLLSLKHLMPGFRPVSPFSGATANSK